MCAKLSTGIMLVFLLFSIQSDLFSQSRCFGLSYINGINIIQDKKTEFAEIDFERNVHLSHGVGFSFSRTHQKFSIKGGVQFIYTPLSFDLYTLNKDSFSVSSNEYIIDEHIEDFKYRGYLMHLGIEGSFHVPVVKLKNSEFFLLIQGALMKQIVQRVNINYSYEKFNSISYNGASQTYSYYQIGEFNSNYALRIMELKTLLFEMSYGFGYTFHSTELGDVGLLSYFYFPRLELFKVESTPFYPTFMFEVSYMRYLKNKKE